MRFNSEYGCKNIKINQSLAHLIEINRAPEAKIILFYWLDYIKKLLCATLVDFKYDKQK